MAYDKLQATDNILIQRGTNSYRTTVGDLKTEIDAGTGGGVTKISAGTSMSISPTSGVGDVTINGPSLSGYATESWVSSQGYLTSAPVSSVNSMTGAVTITNVQSAYTLWNGSTFIGASETLQSNQCVVRDGSGDTFIRYMRSSAGNSSVPISGSELAYRSGGSNDYTRFSSNRPVLRSITGVSYNTDHRNISNVEPITTATNIIQQLNPVMYDCAQEGQRLAGFEAEALKSVVSSAVQGEYNATYNMVRVTRSDGSVEAESMEEVDAQEVFDNEQRAKSGQEPMTFTPTGTTVNPQHANYLQLIPVLTKALQEAVQRVESLETEVAALKGDDPLKRFGF